MSVPPAMHSALRAVIALLPFLIGGAIAADQPQWGRRHSRNMVSDETPLPSAIDLADGGNVLWSASLGSHAYGSPVVSGGAVLIGANNARPRDPRHQGDRAVLLCLNEADGSFRWQLVVPRIEGDKYKDWPNIGLCSAPTVEGDRAYLLNNRLEVICLDLDGQRDGNDGPYRDEGIHMASRDAAPMAVTQTDADIVWIRDLVKEAGVYPHDSAHASILLDGRYLYLNTCNGVDNTHRLIRAPDAPSLVVLDKDFGRIVAQDAEGIGPRIFHSTWSSPALGEVGGRRLVYFGGGDGVCYAFGALDPAAPLSSTVPAHLERVWRFDCDPAAPKEDVHRFVKNREESPSTIQGMPVFHDDRVYLTVGGDIWWGKREAWLMCIDAAGTGEITESGRRWAYPLQRHACSTPSVQDGLVFVADCAGMLHCVDADSGQPHWTHDLGREVWGSTLVADGKIYVGTRQGDLWILAADRTKQVLSRTRFDAPICGTPVAANGVLYVATQKRLYAVAPPGGK